MDSKLLSLLNSISRLLWVMKQCNQLAKVQITLCTYNTCWLSAPFLLTVNSLLLRLIQYFKWRSGDLPRRMMNSNPRVISSPQLNETVEHGTQGGQEGLDSLEHPLGRICSKYILYIQSLSCWSAVLMVRQVRLTSPIISKPCHHGCGAQIRTRTRQCFVVFDLSPIWPSDSQNNFSNSNYLFYLRNWMSKINVK